MLAQFFIIVYGREISNDKCILVPLKGLCIGGGGVNMNATMSGYVLFMHKQENAYGIRYMHYLKKLSYLLYKTTCIHLAVCQEKR